MSLIQQLLEAEDLKAPRKYLQGPGKIVAKVTLAKLGQSQNPKTKGQGYFAAEVECVQVLDDPEGYYEPGARYSMVRQMNNAFHKREAKAFVAAIAGVPSEALTDRIIVGACQDDGSEVKGTKILIEFFAKEKTQGTFWNPIFTHVSRPGA